jgi:hypothetical protein
MRPSMKRHTRQLAFVTVSIPTCRLGGRAGSATSRDPRQASPASRRLRHGAGFVQRRGRGPLADWLRGSVTTATRLHKLGR